MLPASARFNDRRPVHTQHHARIGGGGHGRFHDTMRPGMTRAVSSDAIASHMDASTHQQHADAPLHGYIQPPHQQHGGYDPLDDIRSITSDSSDPMSAAAIHLQLPNNTHPSIELQRANSFAHLHAERAAETMAHVEDDNTSHEGGVKHATRTKQVHILPTLNEKKREAKPIEVRRAGHDIQWHTMYVFVSCHGMSCHVM